LAAEPCRIQRQPTCHGVYQRHLEVEGGLVARDPVLAEPLEHRADVLVLELDGTAIAVYAGLKIPIVLGLVVGPSGGIVGQHREVIRDDQVVLCIRPGPVRHCARL
jgi:hypothetical protein